MRRVHVEVTGRVQGVFFRASCVERARALGLAGWVRNALDERVEAEFEGPAEQVQTIIDWCRIGPPGARVGDVSVREEPPIGDEEFRVVR
ncbi:MAG: acylphosphatase [Actinomycetota bacterium]